MTDSPSMPQAAKGDIIASLRTLGITPGAGIMVHSSLKSFGYVEGGARTIIEALMEAVGPEGTLLMPSFNHGAAFAEGGPGYFHPGETPATNGAIPDLFWRLPGVYRSLNPTHSFAAWGREARRYTAFHHRTLTMGPKSPLGLLAADNGFCLLLGVGYNVNTFHHVVETAIGAPCLGARTEAYPMILPDGRKVEGRTWSWRNGRCPLTGGDYGEVMRARGLQRETSIGKSRVTLFRLQDCFGVVAEILIHGQDGFPPCSRCQVKPRQTPETVPSDWDAERQCLLPDSAAWSY